MGTLRDQLFGRGLLSERQFREAEQSIKIEESPLAAHEETPLELDERIKKCNSIKELRGIARELLLQSPSAEIAQRIVNCAHRFKKDPSSKRAIWFFYQVRDGLRTLLEDKHREFLRRAFRKSGATLDVSGRE